MLKCSCLRSTLQGKKRKVGIMIPITQQPLCNSHYTTGAAKIAAGAAADMDFQVKCKCKCIHTCVRADKARQGWTYQRGGKSRRQALSAREQELSALVGGFDGFRRAKIAIFLETVIIGSAVSHANIAVGVSTASFHIHVPNSTASFGSCMHAHETPRDGMVASRDAERRDTQRRDTQRRDAQRHTGSPLQGVRPVSEGAPPEFRQAPP